MSLLILQQLLKKISLGCSHGSITDSNCHYEKVQEIKRNMILLIVHLSLKRKYGDEYASFMIFFLDKYIRKLLTVVITKVYRCVEVGI